MDALLLPFLGIGKGGKGGRFSDDGTIPLLNPSCICQLPLGTEKPSHAWVDSVLSWTNYNTLSIRHLLGKCRKSFQPGISSFRHL